MSIPLRPEFATWLGWLVERERPLVFIVDATQDRDELVRQCLAIGYERLAGELVGGVAAWVERGLRVATVALVGPSETLGTMLGGVVADLFDLRAAVLAVALLSVVSGLVVAARMQETIPAAGAGQAALPRTGG